jgi:hypothetical protein
MVCTVARIGGEGEKVGRKKLNAEITEAARRVRGDDADPSKDSALIRVVGAS